MEPQPGDCINLGPDGFIPNHIPGDKLDKIYKKYCKFASLRVVTRGSNLGNFYEFLTENQPSEIDRFVAKEFDHFIDSICGDCPETNKKILEIIAEIIAGEI